MILTETVLSGTASSLVWLEGEGAGQAPIAADADSGRRNDDVTAEDPAFSSGTLYTGKIGGV